MIGPLSAAKDPASTSMRAVPLLHWPWAAQTVGDPHRAKSTSQRRTARLSSDPSAVSVITRLLIAVCELTMCIPGGRRTAAPPVPSRNSGGHPLQRTVFMNADEDLLA